MADENIVSKDDRFRITFLTPDVCLTPGKTGYPVPYPITHSMDQSLKCSPNVYLQDQPVYLHNESSVDNVKGDEPGTGGGVKSGVNVGKVWADEASTNVRSERRRIVRHGDHCWMNMKA